MMPTVQLIKVDPATDQVVERITHNRVQEERAGGMVPGDFLPDFFYDLDISTAADTLRRD